MSNTKTMSDKNHRKSLRLLKQLSIKNACIETLSNENDILLVFLGDRSVKCSNQFIAHWLSADLVKIVKTPRGSSKREITLTETGIAYIKRNSSEDIADQHREIEIQTVKMPLGFQKVHQNINESPLANLFQERGNKKAWLNTEEFDAGERLRSDFEYSQMSPSITASWDPTIGGNSKKSGRRTEENLSDRVMDAKKRLRLAIDAVGPEMSSVLLDVCCYLKGLEQVERERQWPRRSAKLLLKAGLSSLARHYNPIKYSNKSSKMRHWSTGDYRPQI